MRHVKWMIRAMLCAAIAAVPLSMRAEEAAPVPQAVAQDADVPVKKVMLFSSGVGYFEHTGTVTDAGSTELHFDTAQINDILKSLVLQDTGGKVTTVSYASQDPVEKTLKSFQVDLGSNPSLSDLLGQLRGAKVKVSVDAEQMNGTILGLEQRTEAGKDDKPIEHWVLNLLSGATIRQVQLDKVTRLELDDPQLQKELTQALEVLAKSRDQNKKAVTVHFEGKGKRAVRLGYVVETPVWKTSYRLILGDGKDVKDSLQGWAIVENQTDNDWSNIQLTLVSGQPLSFIEDLYQPRYIPRPEVQPAFAFNLTPQTYEGAMAATQPQDAAKASADVPQLGVATNGHGMGGAAGNMPQQQFFRSQMAGRRTEEAEVRQQLMDAGSSISSMASSGQLGELFQYTIDSVSLPRQRSAMIPIVSDPVKVEHLSIFNASVLATHPLSGARITNTTGKHLLTGPVTVLEAGAYAGDANLDNVPPGQNRLISYGVDLDVVVHTTGKSMPTSITSASIVKGLLHLQRKSIAAEDYEINNKGEKAKTVLIEHPRRAGWQLANTDKPAETTNSVYRFQVNADAGKTTMFHVEQAMTSAERMEILSLEDQAMVVYMNDQQIPGPVRDALTKAAKLKADMVDTQRQIDQHTHQLDDISKEQNRIRENLKSVEQNSEYYNRLLTKLNEQESNIEKLQSQRDDLTATLEKQRAAFEGYLKNLTVQ